MPFPLQRVLDPISEPVSLVDMKNYLRVDITDDDDLILGMISAARERAEDLTARCLVAQQWVFSMDRFPTWWGHESGSSLFFEHYHPRHHSMFRSDNISIILPRGPVLSVDSITYKDISGTPQTLDPTTYNVDLISQPARIRPLYNGVWPQAIFDTNSITIKFTAGYEQTVTETLTIPSTTPYTVTPSRVASLLSLTSVSNGATPVVGCTVDPATGIITVPSGEAGLVLLFTYQVSSIPKSFIHAIKLLVGAWYENRAEVVQGGGNFNSLPTPIAASSLLATYELFPVGYPKG
jgi:hypothetical protein